jgi:hypothetical protein
MTSTKTPIVINDPTKGSIREFSALTTPRFEVGASPPRIAARGGTFWHSAWHGIGGFSSPITKARNEFGPVPKGVGPVAGGTDRAVATGRR